MLYILACLPAWSPDSSKVSFAYFDPDANEAGIALYDRESGTTQSLLLQSPGDPDDVVLHTQWERDGRRILVVKIGKEGMDVMTLPVAGEKPVRHFRLPGIKLENLPGQPYPEIDGNLYLGTEYLARLNLESGEQTVLEMESPLANLVAHNGRLFYLRAVRPQPEVQPPPPVEGEPGPAPEPPPAAETLPQQEAEPETEPEGNGVRVEVGEVELKDLTFKPLFQLKQAELEAQGIKELGGFLVFDPSGTRLAMVGWEEEEGKNDLLLLGTLAGMDKVVAPEFAVTEYYLGRPEWSRDGKILYVAVLTLTADEAVAQYSLGEIPVEGGAARLTPIVSVPADAFGDFRLRLQVALSPDGATIATTTAYLGRRLGREARALYLIDVRDPARPITRIPAPLRPPPPLAAEPVEEEE